MDPIALIMAGGIGSRFWPLSKKNYPKQFLSLFDGKSLIQETADRILPLVPWNKIYICTISSQIALAKEQLPRAQNWIVEPCGRNTLACLMISVAHLLKEGVPRQTPMVVLPSDHFVGNSNRLCEILLQAATFSVESRGLVALGISPTSTHVGYGYIEVGERWKHSSEEIYSVRKFVEKPSQAEAQRLLLGKTCLWNSGIFVWTLGAIERSMEQWIPTQWNRIKNHRVTDLAMIYESLESLPIDIAILEKDKNVYVFQADIDWSDLGSWNALYELKSRDKASNAVLCGQVLSESSSRCLIKTSPHKQVVLLGVENLIVVESEDSLLIAHRSMDQKVRELAKQLED